ncbi:MAG: DUF3794 domain-containing protein, partial [Clostridia bacterium]|nr:DUF3794 domain-containing protein [Clostridia bacterium]
MNKRLHREFENNCEYLLPDYMGDVKKLLSSEAGAVITGRFINDGGLEISGNVEYELLYVDADGKLTPISLTSDFSESIEVDGEKYIDSTESAKILGVRVRVTGPRKIMLKSDVSLQVAVSEEDDIEEYADSLEGKDLEKSIREVGFVTSRFIKSGEREYAEILERIDGELIEDAQVMKASASSLIKEVNVFEKRAVIKGENAVSAIIVVPDMSPRLVKKSFPFEEEILSEEIRAGMTLLADGNITSVNVGVGSDGEGNALVVNIISEYTVEAMENGVATVVADAYTVGCDCKNSYIKKEFCELAYAGRETFTVEARYDKAREGMNDLSDVISIAAQLSMVSAEINHSECEFDGDILINGVGYETNVDGTQTYMPIKLQSKFNKKVNINCQICDKNRVDWHISVKDTDVACDGEALHVKCCVEAELKVYNPSQISILTACDPIGEMQPVRGKSQITVYYPKSGDRLFDVAKKYKTTSRKIAEDNLLSESALSSFDSPDS